MGTCAEEWNERHPCSMNTLKKVNKDIDILNENMKKYLPYVFKDICPCNQTAAITLIK